MGARRKYTLPREAHVDNRAGLAMGWQQSISCRNTHGICVVTRTYIYICVIITAVYKCMCVAIVEQVNKYAALWEN